MSWFRLQSWSGIRLGLSISLGRGISLQTWKNTKCLHKLNSLYFSHTGLFWPLQRKFVGEMKKFTQIGLNLHKPDLQVCTYFHVCQSRSRFWDLNQISLSINLEAETWELKSRYRSQIETDEEKVLVSVSTMRLIIRDYKYQSWDQNLSIADPWPKVHFFAFHQNEVAWKRIRNIFFN